MPVSGAEHLAEFPINQVLTPSASSWGDAGYNGVWLNPANDWIYRHLHAAEERMVAMARKHPLAEDWLKRALNQMARELLLAQSSDWAFIMTTGTTVPYAVRRTRDHINRFTGLFDQVSSGRLNEDSIREIEWRDSVFQEIDYRVYA
ncbi:MAG TPA: 1,4-alpha-glucan branching protein domain-containing protein [Planctomycetota bacterium]|nr:1,4-alpha-glucan branching protein domain-containing protein [Planctomycetota bacterium]